MSSVDESALRQAGEFLKELGNPELLALFESVQDEHAAVLAQAKLDAQNDIYIREVRRELDELSLSGACLASHKERHDPVASVVRRGMEVSQIVSDDRAAAVRRSTSNAPPRLEAEGLFEVTPRCCAGMSNRFRTAKRCSTSSARFSVVRPSPPCWS